MKREEESLDDERNAHLRVPFIPFRTVEGACRGVIMKKGSCVRVNGSRPNSKSKRGDSPKRETPSPSHWVPLDDPLRSMLGYTRF